MNIALLEVNGVTKKFGGRRAGAAPRHAGSRTDPEGAVVP